MIDQKYMSPPEQICQFDYNGKKVLCNVDLLINDFRNKTPDIIKVKDVYEYNDSLDFDYSLNTDTMRPIYVVRFNDGEFTVLDGNHRLYKAMKNNMEYISAYILNEKDLQKYLM